MFHVKHFDPPVELTKRVDIIKSMFKQKYHKAVIMPFAYKGTMDELSSLRQYSISR